MMSRFFILRESVWNLMQIFTRDIGFGIDLLMKPISFRLEEVLMQFDMLNWSFKVVCRKRSSYRGGDVWYGTIAIFSWKAHREAFTSTTSYCTNKYAWCRYIKGISHHKIVKEFDEWTKIEASNDNALHLVLLLFGSVGKDRGPFTKRFQSRIELFVFDKSFGREIFSLPEMRCIWIQMCFQ
jgi:hypothetical protein